MIRHPLTAASALKLLAAASATATAQTTPEAAIARIAEHMEVVGVDGAHVGTVDKVEGRTIVLTKNNRDAAGRPHAIPITWIGTVDSKILLTKPAAAAKAGWETADRPGDDPKR